MKEEGRWVARGMVGEEVMVREEDWREAQEMEGEEVRAMEEGRWEG